MSLSFFIVAFVFCLFVGWASRMDGGGPPIIPKAVDRLLAMSPVIAFGSLFGVFGLLVSLVGYAGKATGHGVYFLARAIRASSPEFFDFILVPFFGRDPRNDDEFKNFRDEGKQLDEYHSMRMQKLMIEYGKDRLYARCVAGMCVTGLVVTLPLALFVSLNGYIASAILIAMAGLWKGAAYVIGYQIKLRGWNDNFPMYLQDDTEIGEFLNGFGLTVFLSYAYVVMT